MEGLEPFHSYLNDVQRQAGILAEAVVSLNQYFEAEAEWLTRQDEIQELRTIHAAIRERLAWSRRMESATSCGHSKARLEWSLVGLAAKLITTAVTENRQAHDFVDSIFDTSKHNRRSYGTVMVWVGPKGIPDDIQVISISELARESKQPEFEVIQKLRQDGSMLLSEEAFTRLIDRLITDITEGRQHLPIVGNRLSEMVTTGCLRLESKQPQ